MAEKKEKKLEVQSSSFKEIVDGEVVREPEPAKKAKPAPKPTPRPEKPKLIFSDEEAEKQKKKGEEPSHSKGFRVIEDGEYTDGFECDKVPYGDMVNSPESKKPDGNGKENGKHIKVEFTEGEHEKVEKSLKNSSIEGIFNSAAGSIQTSYTTPLALVLGASNAEIGILNSVENLAATVSHVPGAMLTKFMSRKRIWLVSQILAKMLIWIPIAFLPLIAIENRVMILIALLAVSNFFLYLRSPAWSSLMGDLVSINIRGRYFGRRNMLIGVSGVVATLAAGFLILYWGFTGILLLSVVISAAAIFFFMRMYEPPVKRVFHYKYNFSFNPRGWYTSMRINSEFVIFTVYMAFMNFAVDVAAPFYAVYMLKNINIGYEWFAVAVVVGALARAVTHQYWGKLNDRFGSRKILIVCGIMACFVPLGWMLVSNLAHIMIVKIYDGVIFSGFDLVVFNYLLEVTPAKKRPKYVAAHNFFTGFGTVLGDLTGALLAQVFQSSAFMWLMGLQVVFLASFALRLGCCVFLLAIKNIDVKQSDVVPVRYVFWQALAVEPARGIKHAITFTFRYPPKVERELRNSVKNIENRIKLKMNV